MKSKKLILGLTMAITIALGATAYATSTETAASTNCTHQRVGFASATGMRGYDYVTTVLKNKLGMTDTEITDGFNSGKTMYALAKENGMTEDEFKAALLEERNKAIDKAVTDGTITKENGDSMKETLKNNMDNCTGTPGQMAGSGNHGKGTGHSLGGGMRGSGNCYMNNTSK
jgi:hypothetical protein